MKINNNNYFKNLLSSMKLLLQLCIVLSCFLSSFYSAQVGINTTTPSSTLEIKGSIATAFRETSGNTTLTDKDHYMNFKGTTESTINLPITAGTTTANGFIGREYQIRNTGTASITLLGASSNELINTGDGLEQGVSVPPNYTAIVKRNNNVISGSKERWLLTMLTQITGSRIVGSGLFHSTTRQSYNNHPSQNFLVNYQVVPFGNTYSGIVIPNDGTYQFSVRWWGTTDSINLDTNATSAYFMLYNVTTNTILDEIEYYVSTGPYASATFSPTGVRNVTNPSVQKNIDNPFTFTVNLLGAGINAGDIVQIRIRPSIGNTSATPNSFVWQTGNAGGTNVTTSADKKFNPSLLIVQQ